MKSYEYKDDGGRILCKQHHQLRCSECFYVDELEKKLQGMHEIYNIRLDKYEKLDQQNKRYRESLLKIDDYDIEVGDMWDDLQHKLLQIKHIKDEVLEESE